MKPILEKICEDLMKIKKKKGKVPVKDQDKAVKCIRENFSNLNPIDITKAVCIFKTDKLLPDDVCDRLELARYARRWSWKLEPLKALHARISADKLSEQKVSALVEAINEARAGGELEKKTKKQASCLLSLLPRRFHSGDALNPRDCFTCLLSPYLGTRVRLDCLKDKLNDFFEDGDPDPGVHAYILATVTCCLNFLADRPDFNTHLRAASGHFGLISLPVNNMTFDNMLAAYHSVALKRIRMGRLVECLCSPYKYYGCMLSDADVLV